MKTCITCKLEKEFSQFYFNKQNNVYSSYCKYCEKEKKKRYNKENKQLISEKKRKYRRENKEKIAEKQNKYYQENKENLLQNSNNYYENNKEYITEYKRNFYKENKDLILEKNRKYQEQNKETISEQKRKYREKNKKELAKKANVKKKIRKRTDPSYRLRELVSMHVRQGLKRINSSKIGSTKDFLPYNFTQLKSHIESLFEPWMTWENQGIYNPKTWDDGVQNTWTWQLDHIIPHSEFNYTSMDCDEFRECWALSNLRPFSAKQNSLDGSTRIRHKNYKSESNK